MYILYQTTNVVTKHIYVGVHNQLLDDPHEFDGYLGSGDWRNASTKRDMKVRFPTKFSFKEALKIYGSENFIRETLYFCDDEKEIYEKEADIVTLDFIKFDWNYNLIPGGQIPPNHTGFVWINNSIKEHRVSKTVILSDGFVMGRLPVKESTKLLQRANSLKNGNRPPSHTIVNGLWTDERRQKTAERFGIINRTRIHARRTDEQKLQQSRRSSGEKNPMFGTKFVWINDGENQKRWSDDLDKIPEGFIVGYLQKNVNRGGKQELVTCPHCQFTGGGSSTKRWHFDKCKLRLHDIN